MMIHVICPGCGTDCEIPVSSVGGIALCASCGGDLNPGVRLWIRTRANRPSQGPFPIARVRELVVDGKVRPTMQFSTDGSAWESGSVLSGLFNPVVKTRMAQPDASGEGGAAPHGAQVERDRQRIRFCDSCGVDLPWDQESCTACGASQRLGRGLSTACPICAESIAAESEACPHCGERLDGTSSKTPGRSQRQQRPLSQARSSAPRRRRARTISVVSVGLLLVGALFFFFSWNPNRALAEKLEQCKSTGLFEVDVGYGSPFSKDDVEFDVRDARATARIVDVVHLLLQFGHKIDGTPYKRVQLMRNGEPVYVMAKDDMSRLAREYTFGNPVYSIRKWPASLHKPSGTRAFGEWTGGVLGVLKKEMEDVNEAVKTWLRGR